MKTSRPLTASPMLLTNCLLIPSTTLTKTILKLSHSQDKSHAVHEASSYLADKIKEYSNGELVIRIYPNTTLGNERESSELMNSGVLQMVKVNIALLESFAPDYSLFRLPFLFRDRDHCYRVLQNGLGKKILNSSERKGFVGIIYYDGGARSFYSNKPITKPGDLAGMKVRVQQSPSTIAMMKAPGGIATPMMQGELYTALQQGAADGGENSTIIYADMRHVEVAKVYLHNEHIIIPDVLIISTGVLDKLNGKERTVLLKAADESVMQMKGVAWLVVEEGAYDKVKGMNVIAVDIDRPTFKERIRPLCDEFKAKDVQSTKNLELAESM